METVVKDEYNKSVDSLVGKETAQLQRKLGEAVAKVLSEGGLDPVVLNGTSFTFSHEFDTSFGNERFVSNLEASSWNASKFEEAVRFSIRATLDSMLMRSRTKKRRLRLFS